MTLDETRNAPRDDHRLVNSTVECRSEKPMDTVQLRDQPPNFLARGGK